MVYLMADGFGVALGSLAAIVPQPASPGVQVVQRNESASGSVHEQGLWIPLNWSSLTIAKYQALLTQMGLASALTNEITLYVPNFQFVATRYNGLAVRPLQGTDIRRSRHFPNDISIIVKNLVAL